MRECIGLAKAILEEQNKKHDDYDDDGGKDREPLGMRAALSKTPGRLSI
jgi:hypothetical protein